MKNKILIVDDDKYIARLLEEMLKDHYTIRTATDGLSALKIAYEYTPDIILLDVMMPNMTGYEVCEKIRSDDRLPYVKILLLSAKNFLNDRLEGYKAGANDYITKPFDPEEVKAKIKIFLQLKYANEVIRIKDDLLTLLSHEKNTPLNSILGFTELLRQSSSLTGEEKNYVEYIRESAKDLQNNTRKTLLLCQLKEGYNTSFIKASLQHTLENAIAHYKKKIEEKSLHINIQNAQPDLLLMFDPSLMLETLSSILENAIQHSVPSGTVLICFDYTEKHCRLSIADEGEGIQTEHIEQIFHALFNKDVMRHTKGMGISLAIAKLIAELHSGELIAEPNSPRGAVFTLLLPLQPDS